MSYISNAISSRMKTWNYVKATVTNEIGMDMCHSTEGKTHEIGGPGPGLMHCRLDDIIKNAENVFSLSVFSTKIQLNS